MIQLDVPVKPHVYKFLVATYGTEMKLSTSNSVGLLVWHLLRRQNQDKQYSLDSYTQTYSVLISDKQAFKRGVRNLSTYSIMQINSFVDDLIKMQFYAFVQMHTENGWQQKDAILKFQHRYKFSEEELPYDTLRKSFYRYEKDNKLFAPHV